MDALRWTARQSKVPRQFFGWFAAERQAKALGPSIAPRLFAKCPDSLSNGQPKADNLALKFLNKLTVSTPFNYSTFTIFWVVAKEGGISKAADKLDMAVQTVSAQVRELERSLGYALLKPAGRGLVLTDTGVAAMQQADQIFQLGENLPTRVRDAVSAPTVRLAVSISDGLPKLVVHRL